MKNEGRPVLSDETQYWEERYRVADTPWNKGEGSPALVDFLASHPDLPRGAVAIPGCGFGHDVRLWAQAGFNAVGYDLAPSAVQACRRSTPAGLTATFEQGNFLIDAPPSPFDWVFEHTLYCAIQREARDSYAEAAARWLKPGGQLLAVHYLLPPDNPDGPPFGCTREEILARFGSRFELQSDWRPRSWPNREGLEHCFWWRRK
ncbi:MAG: methyltransferase domain-containing protein [Verrucomicrobia bacterium]|nr:methyltransferase domain-containing protein [Verrucomicrobiota bacterium]MBI3867992.1 methyltransferase domain-containing protein [Verrucomicrobiota bacterium]